jgi:hypothetical protein
MASVNMRPEQPESDPALSRLLRQWQPEAELPPRFQDRVWQRIADGEARPTASLWSAFRQWFELRFRRPAVALAYVTLLMGIGLTSGYLHARADVAQAQNAAAVRYVRVVDPFLH